MIFCHHPYDLRSGLVGQGICVFIDTARAYTILHSCAPLAVQVQPLALLLSSKDRSRRARCPILLPASLHSQATDAPNSMDASAASAQQQDQSGSTGSASGGSSSRLLAPGAFLAEPCVLYKLPDGEWWLEFYRFYTIADVQVGVLVVLDTYCSSGVQSLTTPAFMTQGLNQQRLPWHIACKQSISAVSAGLQDLHELLI